MKKLLWILFAVMAGWYDGFGFQDFMVVDSTKNILGRPIVTDIERLSNNVNSTSVEVNPVLSPDGEVLYFSRKNHPKNTFGIKDPEDIWSSIWDGESWSEAENLGKPFNGSGPHYISQIVAGNGSSLPMMLFGNDYFKSKRTEIRYSLSKDGGKTWSKFKPVKIEGMSGFNGRTESFLSYDRNSLFISMDEPNGYGGRDIYVCHALGNNRYDAPVNLGDVINTPGDEISPCLTDDNRILYFSSDGRDDSYGEHDIYVAAILDESSWTDWAVPENLGPSINTAYEERDFEVWGESEIAYFSRGVSETDADIYQAILRFGPSVVTVKGKLVDEVTNLPVSGRVVVEKAETGQWVAMVDNNSATGEYIMQIPSGLNYEIYGISGEKHSEKATLDLTNNDREEMQGPSISIPASQVSQIASVVETATDLPLVGEYIDENAVSEYLNETPENVQTIVSNSVDNSYDSSYEVVDTAPTYEEPAYVSADETSFDNILFGFDQAEVDPDYSAELSRLASVLSGNPTMKAKLSGYTDTMGHDMYNLDLSRRRARAVAKYLKDRGVKSSQIIADGYGETTNNGMSKRAARRVEIELVAADVQYVRFGFDKDQVDFKFTNTLDQIANIALSTGKSIDVSGYTDSTGPAIYNLDLSRRRANAVAAYLEGRGVPSNRINISYHGADNPLDANSKWKNRRVEVKVR